MGNFEKLFGASEPGAGFLVTNMMEDSLTVADLAVFNMCDYLTSPSCEVQAASPEHVAMGAACLDEFPRLKAHMEKVAAVPAVAAYLAQRPKTPHDNVVTLTDADY